MNLTVSDYAEIAYNAYKNQSNGRSIITGDLLPEFSELKSLVKLSWESAAKAILVAYSDEAVKHYVEFRDSIS